MIESTPSLIVTRFRDLGWLFGWFSRHNWLGSGISNTVAEKLRVLPFVRTFSVLAADMLLDTRRLTNARPKNEKSALKVQRALPINIWVLYGTVRVRHHKLRLGVYIIGQDGDKEQAFWSGQYDHILQGINAVSVAIAEGLAAKIEGQTRQWDRARLEKAGIPNSIQAYEVFSRATHSRLGKEKARLYQEAISLDPNFASAYAGLGTQLARHGRSRQAISCFKKQIEIQPYDHQGHSSLGMAYGDQGEYDAALSELKLAVELYGQGDPDVFSNLGAVYHLMKQYDKALEFYDKGLNLNPVDGDIHFSIAKCLFARSGYTGRDEICPHLKKALDLYGPIHAEKRSRVQAMLSEVCS